MIVFTSSRKFIPVESHIEREPDSITPAADHPHRAVSSRGRGGRRRRCLPIWKTGASMVAFGLGRSLRCCTRIRLPCGQGLNADEGGKRKIPALSVNDAWPF